MARPKIGNGVGRCTANGATNLEYEKGNQKDPFDAVDGVKLASEQLRRSRGKEVRWYLLFGLGIADDKNQDAYSFRTSPHLSSYGTHW